LTDASDGTATAAEAVAAIAVCSCNGRSGNAKRSVAVKLGRR
jgi:hypothetical protein